MAKGDTFIAPTAIWPSSENRRVVTAVSLNHRCVSNLTTLAGFTVFNVNMCTSRQAEQ